MRARRRARIAVLQALFEGDTVNHDPRAALRARIEETGLTEDGVAFCESLLAGILEDRPALDALIHRVAPEWPLDQMAAIDRNILRIAAYEIIFGDDTPPKVAVNEAVELAKAFGSDSSSRFVNGVLGTVLQERAGAARVPSVAVVGPGAPGDARTHPEPEAALLDAAGGVASGPERQT